MLNTLFHLSLKLLAITKFIIIKLRFKSTKQSTNSENQTVYFQFTGFILEF